jgi:hypothetical protein
MFHELWVGMNIGSPIKQIWWGWLQKQLIKSLILNLKPHIIHTQTRLYQVQLSKLGFETGYLPLFSNIPPSNSRHVVGVVNKAEEFKQRIRLVLFGNIRPGAPVNQLAKEASCYAKAKNVQFILTFIGRCGHEQQHWAEAWKAEGLRVELLGEQPPKVISRVLSNATIGVSTTPAALIEKSGTVAAMREHGLPVLNVSRSWQPRGVFNLELPDDIFEYKSGNLETFLVLKTKSKGYNHVSDVARQLNDSLLNSD